MQLRKPLIMILLSIASGLLLYLAWPNSGVFPLLFVGFVPLLFSLKSLTIKGIRFMYLKSFLLIFITYIIWTSLSLIWLYRTTVDSHVLTVLLTAINYSLVLAFFPYVYKKMGQNYALIYFAGAMVLVDWISQYFLFAVPYFNLGLGLGKTPWLIQHYQWIGIEGGSLWIILTNLFLFKLISEKKYKLKKMIPLGILAVLIPVVSIIMYQIPNDDRSKTTSLALHHSCFDPTTQESFETPNNIIDKLFESTFSTINEGPSLVIWPETAIIRLGWLHKIDTEPVVLYLKSKLKNYPNTTIVFGAIGFSHAENKKSITSYTTYVAEGNYYYNTHNVAVTVSAYHPTLIKSKEKFIPFHERIPYANTFPFLNNLVESVGTRAMFTPFKGGNPLTNDLNGNHFVSVLCYESLFSWFMIKKSNNKVGAILVHANEHWLKDPDGSEQYLYESVPIAIQGGKPLLRSSNCGISAIINKKGDVISPIQGKLNQNISTEITLNYNTTFYSKIAGSFYVMGGLACIILILLSLFSNHSVNKP